MKSTISAFFHKPILVALISVVIAGIIAASAYVTNDRPEVYQFVTAGAGTINDVGVSDTGSSLKHLSIGFITGGKVVSVAVRVGDIVKKGKVLASLDAESTQGALTQARAAYESAQANYQKVLNGATSATIDVSNTSVETAKQNLDHAVENSYTQVDNLIRTSVDTLYVEPNSYSPQFKVAVYDSNSNTRVTYTPSDVSQALDLTNARLDIGKVISAWKNPTTVESETAAAKAIVDLTSVKNFLSQVSTGVNNIAFDVKYQTSINGYKTSIAGARLTVDSLITSIESAKQALVTANTNAKAVTTSARPEDIASAKAQVDSALGSLQIAQAAYSAKTMVAPGDATVTAVHVQVGEVVSANASVVELSGQSFSKEVSIVLPKNLVIEKDGKKYVLVADTTSKKGVTEKEVITGVQDDKNIEVLSGLNVGEQVAIR